MGKQNQNPFGSRQTPHFIYLPPLPKLDSIYRSLQRGKREKRGGKSWVFFSCFEKGPEISLKRNISKMTISN